MSSFDDTSGTALKFAIDKICKRMPFWAEGPSQDAGEPGYLTILRFDVCLA